MPPIQPSLNMVAPACCKVPMQFVQRTWNAMRMTERWDWQCVRCGRVAASEVHPQLAAQFFGNSPLWTPGEPEPAEAEPPPVVHGGVVGYRAWRIRDWQLYGTGVNRAWVPGVNEATCDAGHQDYLGGAMLALAASYGPEYGRHPAPALGCHCGITCLARFDQGDAHWTNADVFGAIEAWGEEQVVRPEPGDVAEATGLDLQRTDQGTGHEDSGGFILHRNGFRARYGKVVLLALDDDWPAAKTAAVRALAREHGADVCKREHLEDAAKEHGQLVDQELLEWVAKDEPETGYLGSAFQANMVTLAGTMQAYQAQIAQMFRLPPSIVSIGASTTVAKPKPKGIKQTLGIVGPPPAGRHSKGDRVKDSKGAVWQCVKGGRPGTWADEADGEYWTDDPDE